MRLAYGCFYGLDHRSGEGPGFTYRAMHADPCRLVEPHAHEGAHAIAVLGGTYHSLASPGAHLKAGEIVYNPHGVEHADTFDGEHGRFLTVSFDPALYPAAKGDAARPFLLSDVSAFAAVYSILRQLNSPGHADPERLEAAAIQLAGLGSRQNAEAHSRRPPHWASKARERLVSGEPGLSIARLASLEGMHPVAFSRAFRRCFGKAPLAYGLEARLRSSAQDLARGASPISDIAQRWGFFDQAHFSRHFQTCFGASPGQFRRIFQS